MQAGYVIRSEGDEFELEAGLVVLGRTLLHRREVLETAATVEVLRMEDGQRRALSHREILELLGVLDLLEAEPAEYPETPGYPF